MCTLVERNSDTIVNSVLSDDKKKILRTGIDRLIRKKSEGCDANLKHEYAVATKVTELLSNIQIPSSTNTVQGLTCIIEIMDAQEAFIKVLKDKLKEAKEIRALQGLQKLIKEK